MKKTKGFTLVEAIVAIILVAIIAVTAFEFFPHCRRFIVRTELTLMAVEQAREKMEELYWAFNPPEPPAPEEITLGASHASERNYTIEDDATGNYRIVSVTVDWSD